jgi:predicted HTH transcriptional regulator
MTAIVNNINSLLVPRFLLNDRFPYPEGTQLEFKKTFHINQHNKYRETICAFLNTNGGHIIYGILNNCMINGCILSPVDKDNILLFVDSIYNILKKTNGETIPKNTIKVYFEEISKNNYIIIISCYKVDNDEYQFLAGDSWIRMNASNMKTKHGKLYSIQDVANIKIKINRKYEDIINKLTKEKHNTDEEIIIMVSDILLDKKEKEKELIKIQQNNKSYYFLQFSVTIIFFLSIKFLI